MSHLDEVVARVDAAIAESVITHMNELLIALSDDAELGGKSATFSSSVCGPPSPTMAASSMMSRKRAASS
ncbi:Protein of uncharacterised function (DUF2526) [Klebsiella grimontii]|uniref:Protein of uncharacterized function (DUF2526) n=1 Tax=Klebsiella grimontii TaxID=2058152 RepID=A0A7H4P4B3_9ENTR|nr:Protein of uncharacterised function (DUF2526) [Klebsiella grimontii]